MTQGPPTLGCRLQDAVLAEAVQAFRADFQEATRQAARLEAEVATFFGRAGAGGDGGGGSGGGAVVAEVGWTAACTPYPLCCTFETSAAASADSTIAGQAAVALSDKALAKSSVCLRLRTLGCARQQAHVSSGGWSTPMVAVQAIYIMSPCESTAILSCYHLLWFLSCLVTACFGCLQQGTARGAVASSACAGQATQHSWPAPPTRYAPYE